MSNGDPYECNPNQASSLYCCNTNLGFCGSGNGFCDCTECIDYSDRRLEEGEYFNSWEGFGDYEGVHVDDDDDDDDDDDTPSVSPDDEERTWTEQHVSGTYVC